VLSGEKAEGDKASKTVKYAIELDRVPPEELTQALNTVRGRAAKVMVELRGNPPVKNPEPYRVSRRANSLREN